MEGPARPWHKRAIDLFRVVPVLAGAFMTMNEHAAIAKVLTTYAGQFFTEIMAKGDQRETLKKAVSTTCCAFDPIRLIISAQTRQLSRPNISQLGLP